MVEKQITEEQRQIFRTKLNLLIETLGKEYCLPELQGSDTQKSWATDVRIKVVKQLEVMRKTISVERFVWIYRTLLYGCTDSSWWIDQSKNQNIKDLINGLVKIPESDLCAADETVIVPVNLLDKNYNCFKYKKDVNPVSNFLSSVMVKENKPSVIKAESFVKSIQNESKIFVINTKTKHKIEITCNKDAFSKEFFVNEFNFTESEFGYVKSISEDDMIVKGEIESLAMHLLLKGKQVQLESKVETEVKPDCELIFDKNNNICAICRTEPVFTAMKRIGEMTVCLTNADPKEIIDLLNHYDIKCNKQVQEYLHI